MEIGPLTLKKITNAMLYQETRRIYLHRTAHVNVLTAVDSLHISDKGLSALWSFGLGTPRLGSKQGSMSVLRCTDELMNPMTFHIGNLHFLK